MKEIEAKILEINQPQVLQKLDQMNAIKQFEMEFVAVYFQDPENTFAQSGESLRLRKEGEQTVLTFKKPVKNASASLKIREEVETQVQSLDSMHRILELLGYLPQLELRKTRSQFMLGNVHIVIDKYHDDWAHIPAFLEIEAPSENELHQTSVLLGFGPEQLLPWSVKELLEHYG